MSKRGSSILPASRSCSSTMCSTVFCANACERAADLAPAALGRRAARPRAPGRSRVATRSPPDEHVAAAQLERIAVLEPVEQRVVGKVDERDPRLHEQQRPHVRVFATRRRAAVQHRGGAARRRGPRRRRGRGCGDRSPRSPHGGSFLTSSFVLRPRRTGPCTTGVCVSAERSIACESMRSLQRLSAARARAAAPRHRRRRRRASARARRRPRGSRELRDGRARGVGAGVLVDREVPRRRARRSAAGA